MSFESWCLFGAMILGLLHLTVASFAFKAQAGNSYTVGSRDDDVRRTGIAGRLDRAQRNFLETFAIFAAAVILLELRQRTGSWLGETGSLLYLLGRTMFLPLYASGVPWLRTLSWNVATIGLVMAMIAVVWRPA